MNERNIIATKGPLQQKYYKFKILMSLLLHLQTNPKFWPLFYSLEHSFMFPMGDFKGQNEQISKC